MRFLISVCLAAVAWQLHGQSAAAIAQNSFASDLPHGPHAKFIFRASIADLTNGPLKMRLVAQDVEAQEDIITLIGTGTKRANGLVKAEFPFGGRYVGRYNATRNEIVGHFGGFALRGRPSVPRQRFEMTPLPSAASAPAN